MQLVISGRHTHLNALEKEMLAEKLRKFERKIQGLSKIEVVVNVEGDRHQLETILHVAHSNPLVAHATAGSNLVALDMVMSKLDKAAAKLNGRLHNRHKNKAVQEMFLDQQQG